MEKFSYVMLTEYVDPNLPDRFNRTKLEEDILADARFEADKLQKHLYEPGAHDTFGLGVHVFEDKIGLYVMAMPERLDWSEINILRDSRCLTNSDWFQFPASPLMSCTKLQSWLEEQMGICIGLKPLEVLIGGLRMPAHTLRPRLS